MNRKFNHDDIEKWAFFSGDYNKVHFDESVAIKMDLTI
ncbi:MaoC like domain-containing protein [Izhakiella capsodis]|uniref:MaoC like domain-containing protein n=1 Tax=Izhakiella capsodis TaxID=1367852 RepID=A0A1I5ACS2_9GAMM|nr:MaoC like domain-containing protein [Izhakiella capsodis]